MIKFFRKIRYDLLLKNKTGKYLQYAIGEIFLVVVGILIALSINNWSDSKKTQAKVNAFVSSLKSDLVNDLATISEVIEVQEQRLKALEDAIALGNAPALQELLAQEQPEAINIGRNWTFFPVAGAYKAATGTGLIESLPNDKLKKDIINLYEYNYNRINYNGQLSDDRNELLEWESRMYASYAERKLFYEAKGLLDPDFRKQLVYVARFTHVYIVLAKQTKASIEGTIAAIEAFEAGR